MENSAILRGWGWIQFSSHGELNGVLFSLQFVSKCPLVLNNIAYMYVKFKMPSIFCDVDAGTGMGTKALLRAIVGGKDKDQFLNGEFSIPRSTLRTSNFIWSFSAFESNITTQKITMRKECSFDPSHTIIEMIHLFFLRLLGRHRCCSICPTSRIYWWKKTRTL
jgi:hypothetical protein